MSGPFALGLGELARLSRARTRSISAENPTGEPAGGARAQPDPKGPARELGVGWKCRPYVVVAPGGTATLADIAGPGTIQHLWFGGNVSRDMILRIHWDGQAQPSVEAPLCDFFGLPWVKYHEEGVRGPLVTLTSLPVAVNPNRSLNCYWPMPFRARCRITIENRHPHAARQCYHQITYALDDVPEDAAYFHAQFRHANPLPRGTDYALLDGVRGPGHYVGTVLGVGVNNDGWWGEGEVKFFLDGDREFPTICGTGTEDYFGGSYDWEVDGRYVEHSAPFCGMHQVIRSDGLYRAQLRQAMYRWHVMDPIRFASDLRVTLQALGWRSEGRFYPESLDLSSVAYWYQRLPTAPFPPLGDRDALEVV